MNDVGDEFCDCDTNFSFNPFTKECLTPITGGGCHPSCESCVDDGPKSCIECKASFTVAIPEFI
jgi:hypothetical protein